MREVLLPFTGWAKSGFLCLSFTVQCYHIISWIFSKLPWSVSSLSFEPCRPQALPYLFLSSVLLLTNSSSSLIVIFKKQNQKLNPGHCSWQKLDSPFQLCNFGDSRSSAHLRSCRDTAIGPGRAEPCPLAFASSHPYKPSAVWAISSMPNYCYCIKSTI